MNSPPDHSYCPPDTPINILHEDEHFLIVDKPAGLLSVPGRGDDKQDCLIHRIQASHPETAIVHRLDMDTSGIMILARNADTHRRLSKAFHDREVKKKYLAKVHGIVANDSGNIEFPLNTDWPNRPRQKVDYEQGKPSLTHYRVLSRDHEKNSCSVELLPYTGRTHQLRIHMAEIGHPILGERLYYRKDMPSVSRLMLHAWELIFIHPWRDEVLRFRTEPGF